MEYFPTNTSSNFNHSGASNVPQNSQNHSSIPENYAFANSGHSGHNLGQNVIRSQYIASDPRGGAQNVQIEHRGLYSGAIMPSRHHNIPQEPNLNSQQNMIPNSMYLEQNQNFSRQNVHFAQNSMYQLPNVPGQSQFRPILHSPHNLPPPYDFKPPEPNPIQTKTDDELWVETWLSKIGKIQLNLDSTVELVAPSPKSKSLPKIPLHVAKTSLASCLEILNKINTINEEMQENVDTMSSALWKQKTLDIAHLKEAFTKIMNTFDNQENMIALKRSVRERIRKRKNQKARKIRRREEIKENLENRKKIHGDIDKWLEAMKEESEKIKSEENMNKDIDCVLAEVTKKKSDAKKQVSLVTALIKLRKVRENMAEQRGEKISLEDQQAFAITTEKLMKMWETTLTNCANEEHMLKTMLEKTATETKRSQELLKETEIIQQWEKVIFGPKTVIPPDNVIYWALTAAERDMETFIAIRKSWDYFLVPPSHPDGSSIPVGWVLPPESNADWSDYLQK